MGKETELGDLLTEQVDRAGADFDRLSSIDAMDRLVAHQAEAVAVVARIGTVLAHASDAAAERLRAGSGRIIYGGAGTSIRLGVQDGVELTPTFGWPFERLGFCIAGGFDALLRAQEGAEDDYAAGQAAVAELAVTRDDVVLAIAASGRTPYTLGVAEAARARGAMTLGFANVPGAPLFSMVDFAILLQTGPEVLSGSTRLAAGTAQKIALNMWSTVAMTRLGRVWGNQMICVQATNAKLRARQLRILMDFSGCSKEQAQMRLENSEWDLSKALGRD